MDLVNRMRIMRVERPTRVIAIGNYDFRASGTVAKSIEIATAAHRSGLPVELWVVRARGPLMERVPPTIPIVEIGRSSRSRTSRQIDLAFNTARLGRMLAARKPAILLSGGNHFHLPAHLALGLSGQRKAIRFGIRASNSSRRDAHQGRIAWSAMLANRIKYAGADFTVAVCNELAAEIRACAPRLNVQCIPNGVDIDRVERLSTEAFDHPFLRDRQNGGPPLLVSMGRISRQKGFDLLVSAFDSLPPSVPARLLIIGDGPGTALSKLRALAASKDVADRIDFLGYMANPFAAMRAADLFVSASRWEGASNTLLEALACGLPLVATDCPTGNREIIEGGPYGTLAPVEDPQGLAGAIVTELAIGRDRQEQAKGARNWELEQCLSSWTELLATQHSLSVPAR